MSAAKDGSSTTPSPPLNNDILLGQSTDSRLSGMRRANSLSEWQLQAVLFKAKLTQYFDIFISQGGDDIDQIMQCDEQEFLEIMSLVGMASKPLHVRRLQRTLNEFSLNRAQFLMNSVPFVGLPPIDLSGASSSSNDNLAAALQFLIPGFLPGQTEAQSFGSACADFSTASTSSLSVSECEKTTSSFPIMTSSTSLATETAAVSATANVLPFPDNVLMSLVGVSSSTSTSGIASLIATAAAVSSAGESSLGPGSGPNVNTTLSLLASLQSSPSSSSAKSNAGATELCHFSCHVQTPSTSAGLNLGADSSHQLFEIPSLTADEVARLAQCARALCESAPSVEPRFVQNKKKISRELLEVMAIPATHPRRIAEFRRFSAIYGRFDAKRKPDKALTFHEALVNEAAAQLCVCRPELLTRRDELFPMARKLVRLAGFFRPRPYAYRQRRHSEGSSADNAEDVEPRHMSAENQSRTTSRSSFTISASPSPTPSAKIGISAKYCTAVGAMSDTPPPGAPVADSAEPTRVRSQSPVEIDAKRLRTSFEL